MRPTSSSSNPTRVYLLLSICNPFWSLQIDRLCQTETETSVHAERNILIAGFRTGARGRDARRGMFFARAAFGKNTGRFDCHRSAIDVQTLEHNAQIAWFERLSGRGFRFKDAPGRDRASGDQRLPVDDDGIINRARESVSGV